MSISPVCILEPWLNLIVLTLRGSCDRLVSNGQKTVSLALISIFSGRSKDIFDHEGICDLL